MAAFSRMTVQDSRKLIPPEFYPPWVVFQQRQKVKLVTIIIICYNDTLFTYNLSTDFFLNFFNQWQLNWLNYQLDKLWPFINEVTRGD